MKNVYPLLFVWGIPDFVYISKGLCSSSCVGQMQEMPELSQRSSLLWRPVAKLTMSG